MVVKFKGKERRGEERRGEERKMTPRKIAKLISEDMKSGDLGLEEEPIYVIRLYGDNDTVGVMELSDGSIIAFNEKYGTVLKNKKVVETTYKENPKTVHVNYSKQWRFTLLSDEQANMIDQAIMKKNNITPQEIEAIYQLLT